MWRTLTTVVGGRLPLPTEPLKGPAPSGPVADSSPASRSEGDPVPTLVPELVGSYAQDARRVARTAGLRVDVEERATDRGMWGRVLTQMPEPGAQLVTGEPVIIVIGARPQVIVPELRGRDEDEALRVLADAGLAAARRVTRRSNKIPEGHIVRTRPRAGAEVPSGSRVSYVVAAGPSVSRVRHRDEGYRTRARRLPDGTFSSLPG